jgi:spore coat protein U-like protein
MKKFLISMASVGMTSLAVAAPTMAQSTTGSMGVTATTTKLCTAPVATAVALGEYNGTSAKTANSTITYKCTNTTTSTINLQSASTRSSTGGNLTNGTNTIAYTLTGDGSTGTGSGLSGSATDISITVGISVLSGLNPVPGSYSDTINVTVNY